MTLTATLHVAELALSEPVAAADRTHAGRRSLFLELADDESVGWAECATAVDPGTDPTLEEVAAALEDRVLDTASRALRAAKDRALPVMAVGSMVSGHGASVVAAGLVDTALLDLRLRAVGRPLVEELGVAARDVGFAGVVGLCEPARARARAAALVELGASRVRVKVAVRDGVSAISAVLDEVDVPVVADANGSLRPGEDAAVLAALCELPIAWLEQPFAPGNLAATALLRDATDTPIGLDESVRSLRAIRDIARYEAATVLCCKPARLGGVMRLLEARRVASQLGLVSYVGGYFEAGLGRAVLGALAAHQDDGLDGDVASPSTYLVADPCSLPAPAHGRQPLHLGPGCGPPPDAGALEVRLRRELRP